MDGDEIDRAVRTVPQELVEPFEPVSRVCHAGGAEPDGAGEGFDGFFPDVDGFGDAHAGRGAGEAGVGFVEAEDGGGAEVDFPPHVVGPDAGQGGGAGVEERDEVDGRVVLAGDAGVGVARREPVVAPGDLGVLAREGPGLGVVVVGEA